MTIAPARISTGTANTTLSIQWPAWAGTSTEARLLWSRVRYVLTAESSHRPRLVKPTMTTSIQYCERAASPARL